MKDARSMGALVVAAAVLFAPAARAQEQPPRGATSGQLREEETPPSAAGTTNDQPARESPSSAMSPANAPAEGPPSISAAAPDSFPAYRFGYVAGGALALTGAAFGFIAQSEAIRAGTLTSARESNATLILAREHAATANFCFVVAGATALYALVLEFLPRPAADAVSLAFRF